MRSSLHDGGLRELRASPVAKDLAAFAKDGGGVLVGVREDKAASKLTIEPVLLDGLAEAVDQIARSRCDPPLFVVCHSLLAPEHADGRARGILLVEVPPSASSTETQRPGHVVIGVQRWSGLSESIG